MNNNNSGLSPVILVLCLLLFGLFSFWLSNTYFGASFGNPADKYALKHGEFSPSARLYPDLNELDELTWQPVSLPHDWGKNDIKSLTGWYRLPWQNTSLNNNEVLSIYAPIAIQNISIYVNGVWVGSGGDFQPLDHGWNKPLIFDTSASLFNKADNEILIFLAGNAPADNLLAQIYIGPKIDIEPAFNKLHYLRVDLVTTINGVMLFMGFFMTALWFTRSKDSSYGWLALGCFTFWLWTQNLVVTKLPMSFENWHALIATGQGLAVVFVTMSCYRLSNVDRPYLEKIVGIGSIIFALPMFFMSSSILLVYSFVVWNSICVAIGLYALLRLLWAMINNRIEFNYQVLLFPMLLTIVLAVRDCLSLLGFMPRNMPFLSHIGFISIVIIHAAFLISRFVSALRDSENNNVILGQRLDEQQQELTDYYMQLQVAEREQILSRERERIMQDMHDGVGGKLTGILAMLRRNNPDTIVITDRVRESIEELRLMIKSLDPDIADLASLISVYEQSSLAALEVCGITYKRSNIPPDCANLALNPSVVVHILRILQECTTNCIKHSKATELNLSINQVDNCCVLTMIDNGTGIDAPSSTGYGLSNMKSRAVTAGIDLHIDSNANGTSTTIAISLNT